MIRVLSVFVVGALVASAPAQHAYYTPAPSFHLGGTAAMFNYAAPLAPSVSIGAYAVAYRSPTLAPIDGRYIPSYAYAAYAPGFAYPFVATYGVGYTTGLQPYVTGYEGQTMIPAMLAYSAPSNYVGSLSEEYQPAPRPTLAYRTPELPNDVAQLTIHVPTDAEVTVNGKAVPATGSVRVYTTGTLAGATNHEVKVRRGKAETVMNVVIRPGGQPAIHVMQ